MEAVKPWQSKTVLLNFAIALVGAFAMLIPAAKPVSDWLAANNATILMVLGVVGIGLRSITSGKISLGE